MYKYCTKCRKVHDINQMCTTCRGAGNRDSEARRIRRTNRWTRKSLEIRERDNFLCVYCRSKGKITYKGLSVHHIIPIEDDSDKAFDNDNLITLCEEHHRLAESGEIKKEVLYSLIPNL